MHQKKRRRNSLAPAGRSGHHQRRCAREEGGGGDGPRSRAQTLRGPLRDSCRHGAAPALATPSPTGPKIGPTRT
eukprot:2385096-Pyramimonas_sp.AAC.1